MVAVVQMAGKLNRSTFGEPVRDKTVSTFGTIDPSTFSEEKLGVGEDKQTVALHMG